MPTGAITITRDRNLDVVLKLLGEWPRRLSSLRSQFAWTIADRARHDIARLIPKQNEWQPYKQSLDVVRVVGAPLGVDAYSVRANTRFRKVRKIDVPKTVLYVKRRRQLRRVSPAIEVLERYSPWTIDTLPFQPDRSEAMVISRKVHRREVDRVSQIRRRDMPQWRAALDKAGVRNIKKDRQLKPPKTVRALPDVAFEALRLEFGLGGMKGRAHWRPAISRLVSGGIRGSLRRRKDFTRALTSLAFRGWKKWPTRTRHKIRMAEAIKYIPFQKKLGIRVT